MRNKNLYALNNATCWVVTSNGQRLFEFGEFQDAYDKAVKDVSRLQSRRHELILETKVLKERLKENKGKIASLLEEISSLQDENSLLQEEIKRKESGDAEQDEKLAKITRHLFEMRKELEGLYAICPEEYYPHPKQEKPSATLGARRRVERPVATVKSEPRMVTRCDNEGRVVGIWYEEDDAS